MGGDLSPKRLLLAYQNGIFPWYSKNEPILWWSPDPRLVLFPEQIAISRSLKKIIRKKHFDIRMDTAFEQTIRACSKPRKNKTIDTWLVDEMIEAYTRLHTMGKAHSVEAWQDGRLVGGLYGVSLGRIFFGESMFAHQSNASKVALVTLAEHLKKHHFDLIDCQVTTEHLLRMGAREIDRSTFLKIITRSVQHQQGDTAWHHPAGLSI